MTTINFAGQTAVVIHRADRHRAALEAQLRRVGLSVRSLSPSAKLSGVEAADVVFFDADMGHDSLFPWEREPPPVPLVAIIGSEAPGRVEWALSQAATAFLLKPIGSHGAYQALIVATHLHQKARDLRHSIEDLTTRVKARPLVVRAALEVMRQHDLGEREALDLMRRAAMAARVSVEDLAASLVASPILGQKLPDVGRAVGLVGRRVNERK